MTASDRLFTDGAAYERLMGRWSRRVGDTFLDWIDVPKHLRWVDVGCGTGVFTEELIKRCAPAAVSAVDPSEEQLAYARERSDAKMAEFRVGDAQSLPFADGSFDVAVMALVIHFVPDAPRGVAEMARVLRPGGLAASYVWDYERKGAPTAPIYAALRALGFEPPSPPSAHQSSEEALRALWRQAGLDAIETQVIKIPVEYPDFEDYWGSVSVPVGPAGAVIKTMSGAEKERFRARLREQATIAPDGRVVSQASANAIKGRKPA